MLSLTSCASEPPPDMHDPGQLIFFGYADKDVNCSRCHGFEGQGSDDGPDLRRVFVKYSEEKVAAVILNGKGEGPDAMPSFGSQLSPEDVSNVVRFLHTLSQP